MYKIRDNYYSKIQKSTFKDKPIGLKNFEFNCYMNSVIQCLFHAEKFREYFIKKDNFLKEEKPVSYELKNIFLKMKQRIGSIDLRDFKKIMGEIDDSFKGSNGADATDLIRYIFSSLLAEQTNFVGLDFSMMSNLSINKENKVLNDCKKSVGNDTALIYIMNYFKTIYNCGKKIYNRSKRLLIKHSDFYEFNNNCFIEFNLEYFSKENGLQNLFKKYNNLKTESLEFCSQCKNEVNCTSQTLLYETSNYLIIILNHEKKSKELITINYDEYINIENFVEKKDRECFRLIGIVFHSGDSSQYGHYFSICRSNNKFYELNDSKVREISLLSIRYNKSSPYILFYEKYFDEKLKYKYKKY